MLPDSLRTQIAMLGPAGAEWELELPRLVADLEAQWRVAIGRPIANGAAGIVFEAVRDGAPAVLKLAIPEGVRGLSSFDGEAAVLQRGGPGYVGLLECDLGRRALLLERLGRQLADFELPVEAQLEVIAETVPLGWTAPGDIDLKTGADAARWLRAFISDLSCELDGACSQAAVERAIDYTHRCEARFDFATSVVIHTDAHPHNLLESPTGGFKMVDPEGTISEVAHDLAIPLRGWNKELLAGDVRRLATRWCRHLADATRVDAQSIWEWSFIERVSTGLFVTQLGNAAAGAAYLEAAGRLADVEP